MGIVLIAIGLILILIIALVDWSVHIDMVKGQKIPYGWSNYKTFKTEFDKYNWNNEGWYGYSLWDRKNNCEIHASIIKFEGKGMILKTPLDFYLAKRYVKSYFKQNNVDKEKSYNTVDWT